MAAAGGAMVLFAWSLSVPLTGGITLALALQGAGVTTITAGAIINCAQ